MPTLEDARRVVQKYTGQLEPRRRLLFGVMGNGSGVVNGSRPNYSMVRVGSSPAAEVFNMTVPPIENLPVRLARVPERDNLLVVLGVNETALGDWDGAEYVKEHGVTHTYGDPDAPYYDIVYIEKRVIVPLLCHPTTPSSMRVVVEADFYPHGNGWKRFFQTTSSDLSSYRPTGIAEARFVTLSINPTTNALEYTAGSIFSLLSTPPDLWLTVAAPPEESIPVAAVLIKSTTTALEEPAFYDVRLLFRASGGGDLVRRTELGATENGLEIVIGSHLVAHPGADLIVQKAGVQVGQRPKLNFIEGGSVTLTITDNPASDRIDLTITMSGAGSIGGSGTAGRVARFTASTTIGDSIIRDDGTAVHIGAAVVSGQFVAVTQPAAGSGSPNALVVTAGAHTTLAADTEAIDIYFDLARTVQFTAAGGSFVTQRAVYIRKPTYAFTAADTITDAITVMIEGPPGAGANATITNRYALYVGSTTTGSATNAWGVYVLSAGAATNAYGAYFERPVGVGVTTPAAWLEVTASSSPPTKLAILNGLAMTGLTADTEVIDVDFNLTRIVQWTAGGGSFNTQRFIRIGVPTIAFTAADSVLVAVTVDIAGPPGAGTNASINSSYGLYIRSTAVGSGVTSGISLRSDAPSGATTNYAAYFSGLVTVTSTAGVPLLLDIQQFASSTGSPTAVKVTGGAHTTLTASVEAIDVNYNLARTVQFATGALTTQRAVVFSAPTYAFVGASTLTTAATLAIANAPIPGTNATITNRVALLVTDNTASALTIHNLFSNTNTTGRTQSILTSASPYSDNFLALMTHGAEFATDNYLSDSTADSGLALLVAQGSGIVKMGVGVHANVPLVLFTNNTIRMTIAAGGDIGMTGDLYVNNNTTLKYQTRLLTIVDNGVAQLPNVSGNGAGANCWVFIFGEGANVSIFILNGGGNNTVEVSDPGAVYSITAGTASSTNVYWSAGNTRYEIENKTGATRTYDIWIFAR